MTYWRELSNFVSEHYPLAQTWEPESLENWLAWAASKEFLFLAYDAPGGKLEGLAIARPMKAVSEYVSIDTEHDIEGQILYVDLMISARKQILQSLSFGILTRFSNKRALAFRRFGRKGGVKTYDFGAFRRTLLR